MSGTDHAAKKDEMGLLHDEVAKKLRKVIKEGETEYKAGKKVKVPVSAAMLGVAIRFLKDNNITCDEGLASRPIGELRRSLELVTKHDEEEEDLPNFGPN
jgi:hypothetical protein